MVIHRLAFLSPSGVPTGGSIERVTLISPYGEQAAAIGLNSGIGAKLDGDPRAAFDIRFAKGEPIEGESILGTLKRLAKLTSDAVEALAKLDRRSDGEGQSVSVREDYGGWRIIKKKRNDKRHEALRHTIT